MRWIHLTFLFVFVCFLPTWPIFLLHLVEGRGKQQKMKRKEHEDEEETQPTKRQETREEAAGQWDLFVGSLPETTTREDIRAAFRSFDPREIFVSDRQGGSSKFAFVTVPDKERFDAALATRPISIAGKTAVVSASRVRLCAICNERVRKDDGGSHDRLLHSPEARRIDLIGANDIPTIARDLVASLERDLFERLSSSDLQPSEEGRRAREERISSLEEIVSAFWPSPKVIPFGSFVTGLWEPFQADLDLSLQVDLKDVRTGQPWGERGAFCVLKRNLLASGKFPLRDGFIGISLDARVPVLRYQPKGGTGQIGFDVTFNRTLGVINTRLIRDFISSDERVSPFLRTIRAWSRHAAINDSRGGIPQQLCSRPDRHRIFVAR